MKKILLKNQKFKTLFVVIISSLLMPVTTSAQKVSAHRYIQTHKDRAIQIMEKYNIPASIILGVAIHESAFGNSRLAQYLNNHFGIKGKNESKVIKSAYKGYESVDDSYLDFVRFLQARKQYSHLFDRSDSYDYRSWVLGIARGGYASSKTWSTQVIEIIKKYELHKLDQENSSPEKIDTYKKSYIVKSGDTLSGIASEFNTTVYKIKAANGLTTTRLQIGQELSL